MAVVFTAALLLWLILIALSIGDQLLEGVVHVPLCCSAGVHAVSQRFAVFLSVPRLPGSVFFAGIQHWARHVRMISEAIYGCFAPFGPEVSLVATDVDQLPALGIPYRRLDGFAMLA